MIFFGENMFRRVFGSYLAHYHHERNHQGPDNRLIDPEPHVGQAAGAIRMPRAAWPLAAVLLPPSRLTVLGRFGPTAILRSPLRQSRNRALPTP